MVVRWRWVAVTARRGAGGHPPAGRAWSDSRRAVWLRPVPRQLILIPRSQSRLVGATTIGPGYTKGYTPDEMRTWADDLDRCNRTSSAELERWQTIPADQLTPEQRRTLAVRDKYFGDPQAGIKGSLRPDERVELDGGRHRAGYILERGVDPVPVWVSAPEQRDLDAFSAQCERELQPVRPDAREEPAGAAARFREERSVPTPRTEQGKREPDPNRDGDADPRGDRVRG